MAPKPVDIPYFTSRQLELLKRELDAEADEIRLLTSSYPPQVLQRAGLAILGLTPSSQRTGFGGKLLLKLGLDPAVGAGELPQHGLRVGDIVGLGEQPKGAEKKKEREAIEKQSVQGVITKVQKDAVTVALDRDEVDVPGGRLWLVKLANDVTHKRLSHTMTRLSKLQPSDTSTLNQVLFGQSSPTPIMKQDLEVDIKWNDPSLNQSQKDAIRFALVSREIALIHGPPGTGKTHTLIELILQFLSRDQRVLVCGPSNISVDNIVERLAVHKLPMVRLGHPARLLPSVLNHSLEVLTRTSDAAEIVRDIRSEMDAKQMSVKKTRTGRDRKAIYAELKDLRADFRQREGRVVGDLLRTSKVVLSTLHGAGSQSLRDQKFDVVVIDEASQALEAQAWIPLLSSNAGKLVLAGDHLQLPPTIKSLNSKESRKTDNKPAKAANRKGVKSLKEQTKSLTLNGEKDPKVKDSKPAVEEMITLETTLFDRLLDLHGENIKRMLTTQYRMHEQIMAFPSASLYNDRLIAADAVKTRLLYELEYEDTGQKVRETDDTKEPVVFYDTQGGDFGETAEDDESGAKGKSSLLADSKVNAHEAAIVASHVSALISAGVKPDDVAIVTPYNGQLALLSSILRETYPGIELGSVDGFQGREKEAVVVSLVRSNKDHQVGFLAEKRRLNVAMTRPKRHLCIVGDSETIAKGSAFLKRWMQWLEEHADLRYPDLAEVQAVLDQTP